MKTIKLFKAGTVVLGLAAISIAHAVAQVKNTFRNSMR